MGGVGEGAPPASLGIEGWHSGRLSRTLETVHYGKVEALEKPMAAPMLEAAQSEISGYLFDYS